MKKQTGSLIAFAACLAAFPSLSLAQDAAPMTAQDLVTLPRVGAPAVSPDGRVMVYPVTETDPESYKRTTTIWRRSLADPGAQDAALDLGGSASSVTHGPDGALWFLSARGEGEAKTQVWRATVAADGTAGAPVQMTRFSTDVAGYALSPKGDALVVWGEVARDCPTFGCAGDGTAHLPGPGSARIYDSSDGFVRHWDEWETPGTVGRAFAFRLGPNGVTGDGVALDGPAGEGALNGDTPHKPYGGGEDLAWAPDGSGVYFIARQGGIDEPRSTNTDLWWRALDAPAPVNLTADNPAMDLTPAPSPDGKWLAWTAMARPGYEADRLVVWLRDMKTGKTRALTQDFDRSFGSLAWTPDSRWLVATAQDVLDTPAFRIDPRTGKIERLDLMPGNEGRIGDVTPLAGGAQLSSRNWSGAPSEL